MSYLNKALSFSLKDGTIIPIEPVSESHGICQPSEVIDISSNQWNKFAGKKFYCNCCKDRLEQWEVNELFRAYFAMNKKGKPHFKCFYCHNSCYDECRKKRIFNNAPRKKR